MSDTALLTIAPAISADGPYKGLRSYETEDAHLFRGRRDSAERILAKILSSRTTILHAPSAAGKTSLINARLVPGLEARGWMAVRVRPGDDPMASVRFDMIRQLLPPPRAEAVAIARAHDALALRGEQLLIGDLVSRYDALELRDERRRQLVAPVKLPIETSGTSSGEEVGMHPMFCRLLRGTIDVVRFDEHVATVCGEALRSAIDVPPLALASELGNEGSARAYGKIMAALSAADADLCTFFNAWHRCVSTTQTQYGIVLFIDQFEELFTRFADPAPGSRGKQSLDWRIRERFFRELDALLKLARENGKSTGGTRTDAPGSLSAPSLRLVISLRDEFIAQLDRVRPAAERADDATFHLPLLTLTEAAEAIEEPAAEFGFRYERACFDDIMDKLSQEQRFMEPAHLQIVCDRLWRACTQPLPSDSDPAMRTLSARRAADTIDFATYEFLKKAEGILRRFFLDFLASFSVADQLELLEMLELLITPGGTRNIVDRTQLVHRRFRDLKRREELLEQLQDTTVVRGEWRHGTQFIELTHEFLIEPVRAAIKEQLYGTTDNARLLAARRALEFASVSDFRIDDRILLSPNEIDALLAGATQSGADAAANAQRAVGRPSASKALTRRTVSVVWDLNSAEVLLRSSVLASDDADAVARTRLLSCVELYCAQVDASPEPVSMEAQITAEHPILHKGAASVDSPGTPAAIVAEYLDSPIPKIRLNTIRALGWLGDEESVESLTRLATGSADEVAAAAEKQLENLEGTSQARAVAVLSTALETPALATRAYLLLGRLGGAGASVTIPSMSFFARWRLASTPVTTMRAPWYKPWKWGRGWRALQAAMIGSTIGTVAASVLILAAFHDAARSALVGFLPVLAIGLMVATPILALIVSRRSDPIHLHADREMAAYVEVGRTAYAALIPLAIILLPIFWYLDDGGGFGPATAMTVALVISAACVRAGTLVAFEAYTGFLKNTRVPQAIFGGVCGAVVWGLGIVAVSRTVVGHSQLYLEGWVCLLPAWFGLGLAFAEPESVSHARPAWSARRVAVTRPIIWSAEGAALALLILLFVRAPNATSRRFALHRAPIDERATAKPSTFATLKLPVKDVAITHLPAHFMFVVDSARSGVGPTRNASVVIEADLSGSDAANQALVLRDRRGAKISTGFRTQALAPGPYFLEVATHDDLALDDYADELGTRLLGALMISHAGDHTFDSRKPDVQLSLKTRDPAVDRDSTQSYFYTLARLAGTQADSAMALALDTLAARREANIGNARMNINRAIDALNLIPKSQPSVVDWGTLNQVCWAGTVAGLAKEVLPYCDQAVEIQHNFYDVDSRGFARAILGDKAGAIQDLQWYIDNATPDDPQAPDPAMMERRRAVRRQWIADLKAGRAIDLATARGVLAQLQK